MPWSAQWMSSNTSTSGLRRAIASIAVRTAAKKASRMRCGIVARRAARLGRRLDAEQPADQRGLALALARSPLAAEQLGHVRRDSFCQASLGGVGVDDPALGAQHLAERPEHDAGAVREAAALAHRGRVGLARERALELAQEPRLAHAGLARPP